MPVGVRPARRFRLVRPQYGRVEPAWRINTAEFPSYREKANVTTPPLTPIRPAERLSHWSHDSIMLERLKTIYAQATRRLQGFQLMTNGSVIVYRTAINAFCVTRILDPSTCNSEDDRKWQSKKGFS